MITGIGVDLIEIERVALACQKEGFLNRCFTEDEIKLIDNKWSKAAGNFAVKEAVAKMFGTGFRKISLKEIEVLRDELGRPYVNLYGNAAKLAHEQEITTIHVSITNTKEYANAFVVGEKLC
ncbi:holo-ACP synthase [Herbinix luporum]|uniref:holo-ACP synthase n=1 Tax=Herbinix luporum TaxID=1679721 RepID=UPI00071D4FC8|nr:holo-ACP synthase [Herbinix luporum]MDI9488466.1 holo-ACP synthase [Bacillota bacterium]HHT57696.1 holo-ACP synthase [Herbinix luporum]